MSCDCYATINTSAALFYVKRGEPTRAGDGINTRAKVLHDGSSTSLDCQDACYLADDVLGRRPSGHLACQPYSNHLSQQKHSATDRTPLT